jgi:hypothetical protein
MSEPSISKSVTFGLPPEIAGRVSLHSNFWRGLDRQLRTVLVPYDTEPFSETGFLPNVIVEVGSKQTDDLQATADTPSSAVVLGPSQWRTGTSVLNQSLSVDPCGSSALLELRTRISGSALTVGLVATLHDRDFEEVSPQIDHILSDLEVEMQPGVENHDR